MFERFTEQGRQVVVLAQDEARGLKHNYIGTEHILLGLSREQDGLAGRALTQLQITAEDVRAQVALIIGQGDEVTVGQIPFTPRSKKVLELARREALALGHDDIGTEHILLGLVRENGGVAARILYKLGATPRAVVEVLVGVLSERVDSATEYVESFSAEEPQFRPVAAQPPWFPVLERRSGQQMPLVEFVLLGIAIGIGVLIGWMIWG